MTWSSQQVINRKEQACLQKDLLDLCMTLVNLDLNILGIMTNTTSGDMTQTITMTSILENILINQGKD